MKVHEHQAKELLARYGVPVPRGRVAASADEAEQFLDWLVKKGDVAITFATDVTQQSVVDAANEV